MAKAAQAKTLAKGSNWTELRNRVLFLIGALIVFRLGSHIPVPYVNPIALAELMQSQRGTLLDVFNVFSGGSLSRLSIFTLGVMPYISASLLDRSCLSSLGSDSLAENGKNSKRDFTSTRFPNS